MDILLFLRLDIQETIVQEEEIYFQHFHGSMNNKNFKLGTYQEIWRTICCWWMQVVPVIWKAAKHYDENLVKNTDVNESSC